LSIEKHINNKINSGKNIVQHFFEGINHEFVLKGAESAMALDSAQSHASKAIEEKLGMIESLFMKFTPDY